MSFTATINGSSGCSCCGGGGICSLVCSTRGGTAMLCGVSEFLDTPSVPPKKYRRAKHAGSPVVCVYFQSDCLDVGGPGTVDSYNYDGSDVINYSQSDCSVNVAHYTHSIQTGTGLTCSFGGGTPTVETQTPPDPGPAHSSDPHGSTTRSLTVATVNYNNSLCVGSGGFFTTIGGSESWTLTIEDTEADAIDRLLAGPGGIWGDFAPSTECHALWSQRTSGFNFGYTEAKYKIQASGLVSFSDYAAKVIIYRRVYGTGPYEEFEERTSTITADENGFYTGPEETVPNDVGFETYAGTCSIGSVF